MSTIYKWTRTKYQREEAGRGHKWQEAPEDSSVTFISSSWMEEKTGREETRFFRALGATVRVTRYCNGKVTFNNVSPDRLSRYFETFEPIGLTRALHNAGCREILALGEMEAQRQIPVCETANGHVVLCIGTENRAKLDLNGQIWVG